MGRNYKMGDKRKMTVEMYQDVINHLQIDKYRELIIKQDQKITELEKACEETQELLDKQIEATYKLDKENAELKEKNKALDKDLFEAEKCIHWLGVKDEQLNKAKELLEKLLSAYTSYADSFDDRDNEIVAEAEQFLNSEPQSKWINPARTTNDNEIKIK